MDYIADFFINDIKDKKCNGNYVKPFKIPNTCDTKYKEVCIFDFCYDDCICINFLNLFITLKYTNNTLTGNLYTNEINSFYQTIPFMYNKCSYFGFGSTSDFYQDEVNKLIDSLNNCLVKYTLDKVIKVTGIIQPNSSGQNNTFTADLQVVNEILILSNIQTTYPLTNDNTYTIYISNRKSIINNGILIFNLSNNNLIISCNPTNITNLMTYQVPFFLPEFDSDISQCKNINYLNINPTFSSNGNNVGIYINAIKKYCRKNPLQVYIYIQISTFSYKQYIAYVYVENNQLYIFSDEKILLSPNYTLTSIISNHKLYLIKEKCINKCELPLING